jgi:hypothetical protein
MKVLLMATDHVLAVHRSDDKRIQPTNGDRYRIDEVPICAGRGSRRGDDLRAGRLTPIDGKSPLIEQRGVIQLLYDQRHP